MTKTTKKKLILGIAIMMCTGLFTGCNYGIKEKSVNNMIELRTWYFTSGLQNNRIIVKHSDESAVFEIKADDGTLWLEGPESVKTIEVKPNSMVIWSPYESEKWIEKTFIEIILRNDSQIVGYAVILINCQSENSLGHNANVIKSSLFPKVRGQFQEISEEYIQSTIEKIKSYKKE